MTIIDDLPQAINFRFFLIVPNSVQRNERQVKSDMKEKRNPNSTTEPPDPMYGDQYIV